MQRRSVLAAAFAAPALLAAAAPPRGRFPLEFPRDFGSHPDWRTEWWYITGQARDFGFQLTFFRSRVDAAQSLHSAFAAKQLVFAHAALTDLAGRRLLHDQRIARAGMGVAFASEQDTDVRLRDWFLRREPDAGAGRYIAGISAQGFALDLSFTPTQPVLLQGEAGLSRKGSLAEETSCYYSEPQLKVQGRITLEGRHFDGIEGRAWLDHEWSESYMARDAVGWDWIGMNLDDGSALMAFRMRDRAGNSLWAGGAWRSASGGELRNFAPGEVRFEPGRAWKSPATQASYPVQWQIATPAGRFTVKALIDNQELDSRGSTGTVYWEGLSELLDERGARVGRGYLEMTGYAQSLKL